MFHNTLRKCLALFLMANFVLCNTPTYVLHTLFANHTDKKADISNSSSTLAQLTVEGTNCHCNSNVVTAPYLPGFVEIPEETQQNFIEYPHPAKESFIPAHIDFQSLRAPPVLS